MQNRIEPTEDRFETPHVPATNDVLSTESATRHTQEVEPQHILQSAGLQVGENSRRRLVKSALAAAPAVLALRGQSALASTGCASPSRIFSGNLSPGRTPPPCGAGLSPGYWKNCQHLGGWSLSGRTSGYPTQFNACSSGLPTPNASAPVYPAPPSTYAGPNPGDLFSDFFSGGGSLANFSAWRILAYPSRVDKALAEFNMTQIQLARHLIASYLNFYYVGSATFPLTMPQMQAMWNGGIGAGYCPMGTGCTASQLWNAQTIVCYLRNYTMDQSTLVSDTITWTCSGL